MHEVSRAKKKCDLIEQRFNEEVDQKIKEWKEEESISEGPRSASCMKKSSTIKNKPSTTKKV